MPTMIGCDRLTAASPKTILFLDTEIYNNQLLKRHKNQLTNVEVTGRVYDRVGGHVHAKSGEWKISRRTAKALLYCWQHKLCKPPSPLKLVDTYYLYNVYQREVWSCGISVKFAHLPR